MDLKTKIGNLVKSHRILWLVSVAILALAVAIGLMVSVSLVFGVDNLPKTNVDGSDFTPALKFFGYMSLTALIPMIMIFCILGALVVDGIIWGVYGIVRLVRRLIREQRWSTLATVGAVAAGIVLLPTAIAMITTPILEDDTIGYIAYDYNSQLGYTVYVEENQHYVPYLVLAYDYNGTKNALCLRQHVIGGENGYVEEPNGTISPEKVYDGWLEMQDAAKYQDTDVDRYLTGEFLKRFNPALLDKIADTELSFSDYGYEKGKYNNYEIARKFFILSRTELNDNSYYDHQTKNRMRLKYFADHERETTNDVGIESPYWMRTSYFASQYYLVSYDGIITYLGHGARFGVRPAFTISNDTKIARIYDEDLAREIYVLDLES